MQIEATFRLETAITRTPSFNTLPWTLQRTYPALAQYMRAPKTLDPDPRPEDSVPRGVEGAESCRDSDLLVAPYAGSAASGAAYDAGGDSVEDNLARKLPARHVRCHPEFASVYGESASVYGCTASRRSDVVKRRSMKRRKRRRGASEEEAQAKKRRKRRGVSEEA
eukprot:536214-Rhodomonas_salina.1